MCPLGRCLVRCRRLERIRYGSRKIGTGFSVHECCVRPQDPPRHLIVMGNDPGPATQRFDIDVAEGFPDFRVKEEISAPIQIRHLFVLERFTEEAAGQSLGR